MSQDTPDTNETAEGEINAVPLVSGAYESAENFDEHLEGEAGGGRRVFTPDIESAYQVFFRLKPEEELPLKIDIIVKVLRNIVANPDAFEILSENMIDPDLFDEEQLLYLFKRETLRKSTLKDTFEALKNLQIEELRLLIASPEALDAMVLIAGGLIYSRYILKTVDRERLKEIRGYFSPGAFEFIRRHAKESAHEPIYIPHGDFEEAVRIAGSFAFHAYFELFPKKFQKVAWFYAGENFPEVTRPALKISKPSLIKLIHKSVFFLSEPAEKGLN